MKDNSANLIEHLFRTEYGKLVATITRYFGPSHLELAEDVVQETLISAMDNWATKGIPDNPTGWLITVAKRKAINSIKRNSHLITGGEISSEVIDLEKSPENFYLPDEMSDAQLRMIFTCCHPAINIESQIALTLKTLCGFGIKEVANALLTNEAIINKRLYRAKKHLKSTNILYEIPQGEALIERIDNVCLALYLLYNEGYNSSVNNELIRRELCLEAMRLVQLLIEHFKEQYQLFALMSLLCFHTARFNARIDNKGTIVLFEDQDRSLWDIDLIHIGMRHLQTSLHSKKISTYHIEAKIAAEHCIATSFENTNWKNIQQQYVLLANINPNPIIQLNLAIIESQLSGIPTALEKIEELKKNPKLNEYHLVAATQGIFNMKIANYKKAIIHLQEAIDLKPSQAEKAFLLSKIEICRNKLP